MTSHRTILLITTLLLLSLRLPAQTVSVAYYDVDRLYDTIPSQFYDDSAFTPRGSLQWNTERYERKVSDIARIIDQVNASVTALYGVENEQVVRDVTLHSKKHYCYIHRTLDAEDGLDFSLLYLRRDFTLLKVTSGRNYMAVNGILHYRLRDRRHRMPVTRNDSVTLILKNKREHLESALARVREERPHDRIIVMGHITGKSASMRNPLTRPANEEAVARLVATGWKGNDNILCDTTLRISKSEVFLGDKLIDPQSGRPVPTYEKLTYRAGCGDSLPLVVELK